MNQIKPFEIGEYVGEGKTARVIQSFDMPKREGEQHVSVLLCRLSSEEWVTWIGSREDHTNVFWGHYFGSPHDKPVDSFVRAALDFAKRTKSYVDEPTFSVNHDVAKGRMTFHLGRVHVEVSFLDDDDEVSVSVLDGYDKPAQTYYLTRGQPAFSKED